MIESLDQFLQPSGFIIFEAFSKKHIDYAKANENVGRFKDTEVLFSIAEIKSDCPNYEIIELVKQEIELSEGLYHNGIGSVIRFVGRKNKKQLFESLEN